MCDKNEWKYKFLCLIINYLQQTVLQVGFCGKTSALIPTLSVNLFGQICPKYLLYLGQILY